MVKALSNQIIYDDFVKKTILTEEEQKILDMLLKRYSIIKISQEVCMSDRNVSRIIKTLKEKYNNYKNIELAKIDILNS